MTETACISVGTQQVEMVIEGDAIMRMMGRGKAWETETRAVWHKLIKEGDGVIDVGAYTGVYAIASAMHGAKVAAFEPHPDNFRRLKRNAALNSVRVDLWNLAASNVRGTSELMMKRAGISDTASLDLDAAVKATVNTVRIDDTPMPCRIALIKIDVEHHEAMVLQGAWETIKRDKPLLLIESLSDGEVAHIWCMLGAVGYKRRAILDKRNRLYAM